MDVVRKIIYMMRAVTSHASWRQRHWHLFPGGASTARFFLPYKPFKIEFTALLQMTGKPVTGRDEEF